MKNSFKRFGHRGLVFSSVTVMALIISAAVYIVYFDSRHTDTAEGCKSEGGLRICVSLPKYQESSSEDIKIETTIENTTNDDISEAFHCRSTEPSLILNDTKKDFGLVACSAGDFTSRSIRAGSMQYFTYTLNASRMKAGNNTIKMSWGSYESGEVVVEKSEPAGREIANQFAVCQNLEDYIEYTDIPEYCASINIVLKSSNAIEYSCEGWRSILENIDLSLPCDSVMDIGVGYVYVPRSEADRYLEKVNALREVKSATVDTNY